METKEDTVKRANFKSFAESTREDWQLIVSQREPLISALPGREHNSLNYLEMILGAFPLIALSTVYKQRLGLKEMDAMMSTLCVPSSMILATYLHPITIQI